MSTDYEAEICVGVILEIDSIVKALGRQVPEEFHMEDSYNKRTGRLEGQERVVDRQGGIGLFLGDAEVERIDGVYENVGKENDIRHFPSETIEALAKRLRVGYGWNEGAGQIAMGFFHDGMTSPAWVARRWEKAQEMKRTLAALGIREKIKVFGWLSIF